MMLKKIFIAAQCLILLTTNLYALDKAALTEDREIKTIKLDKKRDDDRLKAGLSLGYPFGATVGYRFSNFFELNALAGSNYSDFTAGASALFTFLEIEIGEEKFPLSAGPAIYGHFGKKFQLYALASVRLEYSFKNAPINVFIEGGPGLRLIEFTRATGAAAIGVRYIF